jgi:hypothetical protein
MHSALRSSAEGLQQWAQAIQAACAFPHSADILLDNLDISLLMSMMCNTEQQLQRFF